MLGARGPAFLVSSYPPGRKTKFRGGLHEARERTYSCLLLGLPSLFLTPKARKRNYNEDWNIFDCLP